MSTTNINIRINPELKLKAETILSELGLNMTTAISIYLKKIVRENKIPFELKIDKPNLSTLNAIKEAEELSKSKKTENFENVNVFLKALDK